jgi:hypothetical protein
MNTLITDHKNSAGLSEEIQNVREHLLSGIQKNETVFLEIGKNLFDIHDSGKMLLKQAKGVANLFSTGGLLKDTQRLIVVFQDHLSTFEARLSTTVPLLNAIQVQL